MVIITKRNCLSCLVGLILMTPVIIREVNADSWGFCFGPGWIDKEKHDFGSFCLCCFGGCDRLVRSPSLCDEESADGVIGDALPRPNANGRDPLVPDQRIDRLPTEVDLLRGFGDRVGLELVFPSPALLVPEAGVDALELGLRGLKDPIQPPTHDLVGSEHPLYSFFSVHFTPLIRPLAPSFSRTPPRADRLFAFYGQCARLVRLFLSVLKGRLMEL